MTDKKNVATLVTLHAQPVEKRNRRIPITFGIPSEFDALHEGEAIFDVCGSSYVWQDGEVTPKYAPRD